MEKWYIITYLCPNCGTPHKYKSNYNMMAALVPQLIDQGILPVMVEDAVAAEIQEADEAEEKDIMMQIMNRAGDIH